MAATTSGRLPWLTKVIYGTGDWGLATFNTLRQIFYAIFLTDVVGLDPRLASFAAFVGVIWDAINDPLVGVISDKTHSKWGRRRPFLLIFAIPYGLAFLLLWWAPAIQNQILLMLYVMLAYALSDTFQTLVIVPFHSLTPEISSDYDERTSLAGFRMFFNFLASIATAVAAPMIVDSVMRGGGTQQQGYVLAAGLFGASAVIPYLLIFFTIKERPAAERNAESATLRETVRLAWKNIPFRYATALYMLNWVAFDLTGVVLPYLLVYWVMKGDLLAKVKGLGLPIESAVLGLMLVTATIVLPFWIWLAKKIGKRVAFLGALGFWIILMLLIPFVPQGAVTLTLLLAVAIGISVSAAHILPDAIFPDVIEWDELKTGRRHEGIYYGVKNFCRKLTTAFAIFIVLQVLGWFGYQTPPKTATVFVQPRSALNAIRFLIGPVGALLLLATFIVTWLYPLDRDKFNRVRYLLEKRKARRAASAVPPRGS
ncbi:MAG: glycoside-pentoside-hexuronide (GPH):cation symporter [Acidobacteriota bacterium]|nr:glycoside-pentoside-hexuronide (GPH):cation symporter [Acidobacteriota bacterium]